MNMVGNNMVGIEMKYWVDRYQIFDIFYPRKSQNRVILGWHSAVMICPISSSYSDFYHYSLSTTFFCYNYKRNCHKILWKNLTFVHNMLVRQSLNILCKVRIMKNPSYPSYFVKMSFMQIFPVLWQLSGRPFIAYFPISA